MSISRIGNLGSNPPAAVNPSTKATSSSASAKTAHVAATQKSDEGQAQLDKAKLTKRIANLSDKIETRVQNAIDSGKLDEKQVQAVQEASQNFQALMQRIGNADFDHAPKRQVLYALHKLGSEMSQIMNADGAVQPAESNPATLGDTQKPVVLHSANVDKLA